MHKVWAEEDRNILRMEASGFLGDIEALKAGVEKVEKEIRKLRPGFVLINDMSACKPFPPRVIPVFKKIQRIVDDAEPSMVIRIVKDPIAKVQMAFSQSKSGAGYKAIRVDSLEEAMKIIDSPSELDNAEVAEQTGEPEKEAGKGFFSGLFGFLKG